METHRLRDAVLKRVDITRWRVVLHVLDGDLDVAHELDRRHSIDETFMDAAEAREFYARRANGTWLEAYAHERRVPRGCFLAIELRRESPPHVEVVDRFLHSVRDDAARGAFDDFGL